MNIILFLTYWLYSLDLINGFIPKSNKYNHKLRLHLNPFARKYYEEFLQKKNNTYNNFINKKYPLSKDYYEGKIKRLNSQNKTIQDYNILNLEDDNNIENNDVEPKLKYNTVIYNLKPLNLQIENEDDDDYDFSVFKSKSKKTKSKNFEVIKKFNTAFKDVGGYTNVKQELLQCVDILKNYKKYSKYNIRIPKGLILEGPPGTGKTLLSKALAGEANCSFIAVSGSDFQEKYVGVGSSRIKELFDLASNNIPCIIFIDEIDALGRKRSSDGESSSNERDSTLNSLLVELDGFKNSSGIFVIAATNRIDLLDTALIRPGRIDKKIYIGLPDNATRESIINIHIKGKPHDNTIILKDLVEITEGNSGAQIENLLNEAMLNALRFNRQQFGYVDFDIVLNKMIAGWQPNEHQFTDNIIDRIAIHEMGHAIVGIFSKHHSKVTKVVINLSSPKSPGYTVFEGSTSNIYIRESLFEHLMILLAGRIAEEVFYDVSVTTGANNDFEEALKLAEKMIVYYGMGKNLIYPTLSEKYKEVIDNEVVKLIHEAYEYSQFIIVNCKELIKETSDILKRDKLLKADKISELIEIKYPHLLDLKL
jgi:cell division protease FtsH